MLLCFLLFFFDFSYGQSGFCGQTPNGCLWKYDAVTKKLSITGNGLMINYGLNGSPWSGLRNEITTLSVVGINIIGSHAFSGCSSLVSVSISSSVTFIGSYAFSGCSSLQSISISSSLRFIGSSAFRECSSLQSISMPNSVISMGIEVFYKCSSLRTVQIQNGLISIGVSSFYGCSSLESISIPGSVTTIGDFAFYGCTSLKSIRDGICYFGKNSFYNSGIESVIIGNGSNSQSVYIGEYAFNNCKNLKSVTIKPRFKSDTNNTSIKSCSIKKNAFDNCPKMESFIVDGYVDEVNEYAFSFNGTNEVRFEYKSTLPPQNCSTHDQKNNSMLLPIFSKCTKLLYLLMDYQSNVFCPCDKFGCPIGYIENGDYVKIQNASVPITKTLSEGNEELFTSSEELQVSEEELFTSSEELQVSEEELFTSSEELQVSEEELFTSSEELQVSEEELPTSSEKLFTTKCGLNETRESGKREEHKSSGNENEAVMNAFIATLLFVAIII